MKTFSNYLLLLLFLIGMGEIHSQRLIAEVNTDKLELPKFKRSSTLKMYHKEYFHKMKTSRIAQHILMMRKHVAMYNCKNSKQFTGQQTCFEVKFKSDYGYIFAHFNSGGEIIKTEEVFSDIRIPNQVIRSIFYIYPEWTLEKTKFYAMYELNQPIDTYYEVEIKKGYQRKTLKVNNKGEFL
ncbi:hypothetical protein GZ212_08140 [Mangrovimonas sp. CR14]|uniref:hypothetical protein n=1 Tax=Mangrovimonas sp. CR14 TaxID=2706120 RepID=UPI001421F270|nr:hypothetical protein [Mangrovimonas sp. CR14]NIK92120.1 hypothetical protein [Mangrovimonas sp. CR14]